MKLATPLATILLALLASLAQAQMPIRPPAFIGGVPGMAQFQSIQMQRHQARTLLYREALQELRRNPQAADVPECPPGGAPKDVLCIARAEAQVDGTTGITPPDAGEENGKEPRSEAAPTIRKRHAVLFGNNDYTPPIPGLETPIADVENVASILSTRFGYETTVLKNPGKAQIVAAMNRVAAEAKPADSILLFYAGHGYLVDDTGMGFWIPTDASVKTAAGWISNSDIAKLLAAIPARQLILVSDSCFSGTLTKEQKVTYRGSPKAEEVLRRRSVLVLTSGDDEPVSDEGKEGHSIFAWSLIDALRATDGITPGYEVYRKVYRKVVKDYPQEPQYGAVVSAGHASGGEYLFETKQP